MGSVAVPLAGLEESYDYIIVGGGTAGCVLANRLTEDKDVRVLLLEAGDDRTTDPLVLTPGLVAGVYGKDEYDWNFQSVPQSTLNNRIINQARGKMLGGSSALNFMMLVYPSKASIDAWAAVGNPNWNFEALKPYLKKFATVDVPSASTKDICSITYNNDTVAYGDGPVQVSFGEGYGVTNKGWFDTFASLDLLSKRDARDGQALGAFQNASSIDPTTKTRSFSAVTYLTPEVRARENLKILTNTHVNKVLFDTTGPEPVATGVEINVNGIVSQVSASLEVILSAGALQSPQILELSGVGSKEILAQHNIPVVFENPAVGEGMQDHPIVCQSFEVKEGTPSGDVLRDPAVLKALLDMYTADRSGPLGQLTISVAYTPLVNKTGVISDEGVKKLFAGRDFSNPARAAIRDIVTNPNEPTFQYILFPTQVHIADKPDNMATHLIPVEPENFLTVMTILNSPFSRGSVHIQSSDPKAAPVWDPKYNHDDLDMELLARGVQFVEHLVAPESALGKLLNQSGRRLPQLKGDDLETAKEIVRQRQISVFHVSGSCSMRPREQGGVVNERLQVYGAKGLRVVDASIFPIEPAGNIQSVVYSVAERAADLIKEDRRKAVKV
ncbi:aryl-alcohol dehydrogenase [Neurospora crassa OR74A]|uniref:Aryl-alcohol dehydrogenase n=1 Tax=Neurospora crassa (strain ATCC 24698 / 74-OR23-1A / CBS 708.71 / DSM 1257 / FGSC 987) TaxID=367110 RepID=Q7S5S3_NEUCR|nr:aryl-alcohol dehydrogenase [Neurospora crassa OR74A]EAA30872.2 aryl-alcohol dehydrogenase [Neurospora crassa OR74A]|eukprot:XP_960108.2 aryl-alcohol dehydrogenase [Neurospora crassa OR74A]